jgi:2-dehydro-3-deoxygluconokinase
MLELTRLPKKVEGVKNPMSLNYGGDTINTSIYLARNGVNVSYISGLGDDINSDWLLNEWQSEGVDCSMVTRFPNSVPGMYMINVADDGERSFLYWRKGSPASRLFDDNESVNKLFESIAGFGYLYLSGISLAILPDDSQQNLFSMLEQYRQQGGRLIFDGNYRPNLWSSREVAREAYEQMYKITDIALPTLEDESLLFGFESAEQVMQAIREHGVSQIVVKMGPEGCLALHDGVVDYVEAEAVTPVDTTAAGDSFNAGYLAARFKGLNGVEACRSGHRLASRVIQHPGAIVPA